MVDVSLPRTRSVACTVITTDPSKRCEPIAGIAGGCLRMSAPRAGTTILFGIRLFETMVRRMLKR